MKKIILFVLAIALTLSCFAGCASGGDNSASGGKNVEGSLSELMQKLYDSIDPPIEFVPVNIAFTESGDEFGKPVDYFIGSSDVPFAEGLASEPAMGAIPHSIVLLRMKPDADIEAAKKLMKDTVDPRKWICVGVDPSDVIVDSIGDLVVVIISKRSADFHEAFKQLAQ